MRRTSTTFVCVCILPLPHYVRCYSRIIIVAIVAKILKYPDYPDTCISRIYPEIRLINLFVINVIASLYLAANLLHTGSGDDEKSIVFANSAGSSGRGIGED